jgi:hypothetical protein
MTMLKELCGFRGYFMSVGIPTSHLIVFLGRLELQLMRQIAYCLLKLIRCYISVSEKSDAMEKTSCTPPPPNGTQSQRTRRGSEMKLIFITSDKHRYKTFVKIKMKPYNRNGDSTTVFRNLIQRKNHSKNDR